MDDDSRRRSSDSIERGVIGHDGLATSDQLHRSGSQHPNNRESKWKDRLQVTGSQRSHERGHDRSEEWKSGRGEGCAGMAQNSGGRWPGREVDKGWREADKGLPQQRWRTDQGGGPILFLKLDLM